MTGIRRPCEGVTRFIRCLRGGSQPFLAEASDGKIYVVKFTNNIQGPNLAFNEAAGTELYRACGLTVSPWQPLLVTSDFLDQNVDCWMQIPTGRQKPVAGLCFGSRYQGSDCGGMFEVLPGSHFQRVKRIGNFWLAWLIDICAAHADVRQAIFLEQRSRELDTVFIDFGHMFGGPAGEEQPCFRASRYRDGRIYVTPSAQLLDSIRWIAHNLNADLLWKQLTSIPQEWQCSSASVNFSAALNHLLDARFVETTLDRMVDSVHSNAHDRLARISVHCSPGMVQPLRSEADRRYHFARKRLAIQ